MIIQQLIDELTAQAITIPENTVDTIKYGSKDLDVRHIGVCFTATAAVLEKAASSGVEFVITHEPVFYDHFDRIRGENPLVLKKLELIRRLGITIWRYHDHMHRLPTDGIIQGIIEKLGWEMTSVDRQIWELKTPKSALEAAEDIRTRLHCGGVRVCGRLDRPYKRVAMAEGDSGVNTNYLDRLLSSGFEGLLFAGEACEWGALEQIRDAGHFDIPISAVVIGHAASEEAGMELLAKRIREEHPGLIVDYLPTGEVYTHL